MRKNTLSNGGAAANDRGQVPEADIGTLELGELARFPQSKRSKKDAIIGRRPVLEIVFLHTPYLKVLAYVDDESRLANTLGAEKALASKKGPELDASRNVERGIEYGVRRTWTITCTLFQICACAYVQRRKMFRVVLRQDRQSM